MRCKGCQHNHEQECKVIKRRVKMKEMLPIKREKKLPPPAKPNMVDTQNATDTKPLVIPPRTRPKMALPIVDWALSPLYQALQENTWQVHHFRSPHDDDIAVYNHLEELDAVIDLVEADYSGLKRTALEELQPFHIKAGVTLRCLLAECGFKEEYADSVLQRYREITIEDTLKLLVRCKWLFLSRPQVIRIMRNFAQFDSLMAGFKALVDA